MRILFLFIVFLSLRNTNGVNATEKNVTESVSSSSLTTTVEETLLTTVEETLLATTIPEPSVVEESSTDSISSEVEILSSDKLENFVNILRKPARFITLNAGNALTLIVDLEFKSKKTIKNEMVFTSKKKGKKKELCRCKEKRKSPLNDRNIDCKNFYKSPSKKIFPVIGKRAKLDIYFEKVSMTDNATEYELYLGPKEVYKTLLVVKQPKKQDLDLISLVIITVSVVVASVALMVIYMKREVIFNSGGPIERGAPPKYTSNYQFQPSKSRSQSRAHKV